MPPRLLVLSLLMVPLSAQSPAPSPTLLTPPVVVPIHEQPADDARGGGTWAVGSDYKVRFDGGMQFVPYLGAAYPHNQPFGWRTEAITIGGLELPLEAPRGRAMAPTRYEYDLGAAVEGYEVRAAGLEQTFTFAARPGQGELRIRGRLATTLAARPGEHGHAAVTFRDANGTAIVGFGASTAVDSGGRTFPVDTVTSGSTLELVLAAEHVAAARWPLVIDPLLSNLLLSTSGTLPFGQGRACDVARDEENHQLLVAIQRHASAADEDLFLRLFSDGFAGSLGLVFADLDTTWDATEPRVTFVGGADRWVAVFTRAFHATGTKAVRWHPHAAANPALDTTVGSLAPPAGSSDLRPAVGGYGGATTFVHAVICWQRDSNLGPGGTHTVDDNSRVWFARLDLTGAGAGTLGAATEVIGTGAADACDHERPSINRLSLGNSQSHFLIAFQVYWNTAPGLVDDWDVEGRRIDGAGAVMPGVWTAASNPHDTHHKLGPLVDGMADDYVVAYTLADNTTAPQKTRAIEGSRVASEGYNFAASLLGPPGVLFDTGGAKSMQVTGLSYDALTHSHAVVVYQDELTNRLYAEKVGYLNQSIEEFTVYATAGHVPNGGGAAFDRLAERHVFVFGVDDGIAQPVYGNGVTYVATPAPASYGTPGCAQGGVLWNGYHRIGHQEGSVHMIAGPANTLVLLAVSLGSANVPLASAGLGSCNLLVDPAQLLGTAVMLSSGAGYASLALPIPESLPPFTCYFQWFAFPGALVATRNTNGLSVVFDR
ncbi:MAG TPA: hypothetical protein VF384_20345 [Planctomycetota bacterium]